MPPFAHNPVMVEEVLAGLRPGPGGRYADGTLGGAGHAAALLAASSPSGWLSGCDRDGDAVEAAARRLAEFAGRFEIRRGNFDGLSDWVGPGSCAGVLFDLGVSSPQLNHAARGFSFMQDGALDMRMDDRQKAVTEFTTVFPDQMGKAIVLCELKVFVHDGCLGQEVKPVLCRKRRALARRPWPERLPSNSAGNARRVAALQNDW